MYRLMSIRLSANFAHSDVSEAKGRVMMQRIITLALALVLLNSFARLNGRATAQDTNPHREAIQRFIDEAYNRGEAGVVDEIFAPPYIRYPVNADATGIKNTIWALRAAMPDLQATPVLLLAEGNSVALSLSIRGTLLSDLVFPDSLPIPATNQPLELVVNSLYIFNEQGTITIEWNAFDNLSFLANIGLLQQVDFWNAPSQPITPVASGMTPFAQDLIIDYLDAMNRGDYAYVQARLQENFIGYNPFGSLDAPGYVADGQALYNALAGFNLQLEVTTAEGDWIAAVYVLNGSFERDFRLQDGTFVPPTGGVIKLTIITFFQFDAEGRFRETREIYDGWSLLSQIKLVSGEVPGSE
jgi:predicted ester cyclase